MTRASEKVAVPRLRFKGCEGAWHRAKLESFLVVSDEKNDTGRYGVNDVFSVSREYGVINQIEYQGRSFAGASLLGYKVIHKGEIAYTKSPLKQEPFGIIKANNSQAGIVSSLYGVYKPSEITCPDFVQTYFDDDGRLNAYLRPIINKGAKNTILVSDEGALSGDVCFPESHEQSEVAESFKSLQRLIFAASHRLASLRQLKRAMLVKMFPRPGQCVPEIRFKGFDGKWEELRVRDVAERVTRKNLNQESDLPLTISAEHGLIDQGEVFNNRIAAKDVSNYYLVVNGEFAYNRSASDGAPFGAVKRLDRYAQGVLSTLYMVFALKAESVDSDYLVQYYATDLWHRDIALRAAEGARNHGLLNISVEDFFDTRIVVPPFLPEQRKIAAFFRSLDRLIGAAEKKVAKLRQVKASLLERMFV